MKTESQLVREARALITDKAHWRQGFYAGDAVNLDNNWYPEDSQATRFCMLGAIWKVSGHELKGAVATQSLPPNAPHVDAVLQDLTGYTAPARFNDEHTHAEVLALMDKAAAELERLRL